MSTEDTRLQKLEEEMLTYPCLGKYDYTSKRCQEHTGDLRELCEINSFNGPSAVDIKEVIKNYPCFNQYKVNDPACEQHNLEDSEVVEMCAKASYKHGREFNAE